MTSTNSTETDHYELVEAEEHTPLLGEYALYRYADGRCLREASAEEAAASIAAAADDGGAGVITVNGESCYVL